MDDDISHQEQYFDRELTLFLNELRVALPGVQILFAFMLGLPFTFKWSATTAIQREVYFLGFLLCAAASALYIAPSVYHRLHWRAHVASEAQMLVSFNRMAIGGGICLAGAMTCTSFVVTDVLFGPVRATLVSVGLLTVFSWFWFGFPFFRHRVQKRAGSDRRHRP